jgi:hypothetical protein
MQLTGLTVADRWFYYTSGLHDRTRYEELSKQPKSLDEALAVATQFNRINSHAPVADIHATTIKSNKPNNHAIQASLLKSYPVKAEQSVTCYKCNRQGHYSHECRSSVSTVPKSSTDRSSAGSSIGKRPQYIQALTFTRSDIDTLMKVEGSITISHNSPVL